MSFLAERVFLFDEISLFLSILTILVLYLSFISSLTLNRVFVLVSMFVPCIIVFSSRNLFILYLFYEFSLLPILYIILKWGSYPERSVRAFMLLIYTSFFTMPLLGCILSLSGNVFSLSSLLVLPCSVSSLFTLVIFLAFAVKLPIYGLHFWLPMAHVEAPTFGSMILAGVLLKLGGVGLLRFLPFLDTLFLRSHFFSYFIFFFFISSLVCCFQSDFKRLVAYSSVSHMMSIPLLLVSNLSLSVKSILLIIIFHGLSSPVMFILVGLVYSFFGTRQLVITRGLLLLSPLLAFVIVLSFFYTLSAPPYPSFIAEVFFFISVFSVSSLVLIPYLFFIFFSLVYNLNWLVSILFSTVSSPSIKVFFYSSFLPLFVTHVFSFLLLLLVPLF